MNKRHTALLPLADLAFENSFVRDLPGDPVLINVSRQVSNACYTRVEPTPVASPRLVGWADAVGELLGIAPAAESGGLEAAVLGGNRVLPGMQPYAARYGGHQFGQWAGQLGDGRAITLAEVLSTDGVRHDLQLKGAGKTPYSRHADGRAVLRSSLREFVCSEAMHHLGVPSTRALSLVLTGEPVVRDMFYDGHPRPEPGAIVCRVAPSFVRFGNFQIHAAHGETQALKRLAEYVVREHFPELGEPSPAVYARWYHEICRRTATLMADWMRVGFVHGVINTDNMSILGLTIDYGPYGWLEPYDPQWTPNTTDAHGRRYCYGNQPEIALWNLARLAEALMPLVPGRAELEQGLELYARTFQASWQQALAAKLGLEAFAEEDDAELAGSLFSLLAEAETDFTLFFRNLARVPLEEAADEARLVEPLLPAFYAEPDPARRARIAAWLRRYSARARLEGAAPERRAARMHSANPKYVFRNYLAQQAIDAMESGDASVMQRLMKVLRDPYDEHPGEAELARRRPEWARDRPGCSALSCSS
jgi:serine/tyrosine/threonine adenylyltransferase